MAGRSRGSWCLWLLVLACTLSQLCTARSVEHSSADTQPRHRRSLLGAAPQQISQCEWISGEGCALHPSYVTYTLNRTNNDVVARYVTSALACAGVIEKGACEGVSYCVWDPSFSNGQQGCFLAESAMLALQQQCVAPASRNSLAKLQSCMEARHSCQCSGGSSGSGGSGSSSSACQLRQQQLLASYTSSSSKVCQSLLGCWLASLNSSSADIVQLVEAQLGLVQPRLESLKPSSNSSSSSNSSTTKAPSSGGSSTPTGRRRSLQQNLPSLSDPVLDDISSGGSSASSDPGYIFESGSLSPGTAATPGKSSTSSTAGPSVGMNDVILTDDHTTAPSPSGSPVQYGKNIPGATTSSTGGMNDPYQLEQGTAGQGNWGSDSGGVPVDPDQVFGSNSTAGSSSNTSSSGDGSSGGSSGEVTMTGGNAPASLWKCAGTAAIKADTTRKWADVDYNSKALTLATWLKVIQPTVLIDWGVQVMECFKAEVTSLASNASSSTTKPNKESMEYAIVALIRTFSAEANTFRAYLQAGKDSRVATGIAGLGTLSQQVFPDQLRSLQTKYNSTTAYDRDVMLQAAALIADMQWFTSDALALASAAGSAAQQQEVFEAVVSYGEEMMRRCLYWMFHVQFDGPPAHLPGVPTTTAASSAVADAFDGLASASFPAAAVAADTPAWQQVQGMLAVAAGWVAKAAASGQLDGVAQLGNVIDGLAKAHVQDFWGTRVEWARAGAPDASRQLALVDPSKQSPAWQPLRDQQVQLLMALQQVAAGNAADDALLQLVAARLRDVVTAAGSFLVDSGSNSAQLSDALQYSSYLAALVRQCKGSPVGLKPMSVAAAAAAGVPATAAAACSLLSSETSQMATSALAGTGPDDAILSNLVANMNRQWVCAARDPDSCTNMPGCQLALAGSLVPGSASAGGSGGSTANAALLLEGSAASDQQLTCQAADAGLLLSSYTNSSKSGLAVSPACEAFLDLPACESMQASSCEGYSACRWEPSSQRNLMHTAGNLSGSAAANAAGSSGVCSMDWVQVLKGGSNGAYSGLQSMVSVCSGISDTAACTAQTMVITLDTSAGGAASLARIWVPALVVAAVLGLVLFAGVMYWRMRSSSARRAAEEARSASGGSGRGSGKKGKDGKDGKAKAKGIKKKVKRAEPGSYKPDLMRDSFTDYMRSAPQQFENGVAIAKAAMAAGSLDAGVAAADVAGGRQVALTATAGPAQAMYPQQQHQDQQQQQYGQHWQQQQMAVGGAMGGAAGWTVASGSLPPLPPSGPYPMPAAAPAAAAPVAAAPVAASTNTNDLIDLQTDVAGRSAAPMQQQQQGPYAMNSSIMYSGSVWGAAGGPGGANGRLSGGGVSAGLSGGLLSGGLSSEMDLMDAGASLALTSSLGLVSSLPQHASVPLGIADAQQYLGGQGMQQEDVVLGLPGPHTARSSSGRSGFTIQTAANPVEGANSGSLLLGRPSGDIEDGTTTPTSSCCHDSVCTFRHGAGSTIGAGSTVGTRSGGPGSSSSSWRSGSGVRTVGSGRALSSSGAVGSGQGLGSTLSGALSGALSRSSWSSAMSTDMLMSTQHSAVVE